MQQAQSMQWTLPEETGMTRMVIMMRMVKLQMRCELMRTGRAMAMLRLRRQQQREARQKCAAQAVSMGIVMEADVEGSAWQGHTVTIMCSGARSRVWLVSRVLRDQSRDIARTGSKGESKLLVSRAHATRRL
ncbi:hypothetical protein HDV57DRAFT_117201 [Trichoderma longibrachiatum]